MLPSAHRLRNNEDFDRVYRDGKSLRTALFRIIKTQGKAEETRFGIVISNKTMRQAVKRNQKRRQAREALSRIVKRVEPGHDVVLVGQHKLADASFAEIAQDITNGLAKAGLLTS